MQPQDSGAKHQRFADLETGLQGLLHFYDVYAHFHDEWARKLELRAIVSARWYYSALILHADVLFTSDRGKDLQAGAALRALRDLRRPDLVALLEGALAQPATANGRTLAETIKRIRNEVLVHHSFDLSQQGSALLFLGEPSEQAGLAFSNLLRAVRDVLGEIQQEKLRLVADLVVTGNIFAASERIDTAPELAGEAERSRRRAQRTAARRASADG